MKRKFSEEKMIESENVKKIEEKLKLGKRKRKGKKRGQVSENDGSEATVKKENLEVSDHSDAIKSTDLGATKNKGNSLKITKEKKEKKYSSNDFKVIQAKSKSKKKKNMNNEIITQLSHKASREKGSDTSNVADSIESEEESKNSDFDIDSYPSDSEEESQINSKMEIRSDGSTDESSTDDESKSSRISEFDMDSYPSDTDDEMDKKRGLPVNAVPSEEIEEMEKRTIFVGNLPYTVERAELKKWFSKFGKVECVRLRSAPVANLEVPRKVAVIKKTFHENRSNIHAYIRYRTLESANNALQANGAVFKEHILRVDHSKHEGSYDSKRAIFIGNVPFSLEENTLRHFFSECGEIESVRIVRDKNTGVGKGFAYVNFKCSSSVPLALKLDGEVLEKRELRVKQVKYMKKNAKPFQRNIHQSFKGNEYPKHFRNNKNINKSSKFQENSKIKTSKFQGEMSKRKTKKFPKKKSFLERKRDKLSKIFSNKSMKK